MQTNGIHSGPSTSNNSLRRNILIVGETGIGKSSLVNLISGRELATTSSNSKLCTLSSQEYNVTLDGVEFTLHDTAGLHEAQGNMDTVYQACALVSKLQWSGGINLLVFCMRGGGISITMLQTYNLFVEILCNRQVPVVIVATHLEMHDDMEQWWRENERIIKEYGLRSHGHACITTFRGYKNMFSDKYEESRGIIRKLLLEYSSRAPRKEESRGWVRRAAELQMWLSRPTLAKQLDGRDLRRELNKRCGFSIEDAELVAQRFEQSRVSEHSPEEDRSWFD